MYDDQTKTAAATPADQQLRAEIAERGKHAQEQLAYHHGQAEMWRRVLDAYRAATESLSESLSVPQEVNETYNPEPSSHY